MVADGINSSSPTRMHCCFELLLSHLPLSRSSLILPVWRKSTLLFWFQRLNLPKSIYLLKARSVILCRRIISCRTEMLCKYCFKSIYLGELLKMPSVMRSAVLQSTWRLKTDFFPCWIIFCEDGKLQECHVQLCLSCGVQKLHCILKSSGFRAITVVHPYWNNLVSVTGMVLYQFHFISVLLCGNQLVSIFLKRELNMKCTYFVMFHSGKCSLRQQVL